MTPQTMSKRFMDLDAAKITKGRIFNHGFHGWARMVERVKIMAFAFDFRPCEIGGDRVPVA
jgi:hypothetical protein